MSSGRSAAWLARLVRDQEAGGSNPLAPTISFNHLDQLEVEHLERLARSEVLTLVAEGQAKAILVPVEDGDVGSAYEAYSRGRAMMAAARLRREARDSGASGMTLRDVNALIAKTREETTRRTRR